MKNEIIQKLGAVINALNNVYVKGEQNLANLSGSIGVLREVAEQIGTADFSGASNTIKEPRKEKIPSKNKEVV